MTYLSKNCPFDNSEKGYEIILAINSLTRLLNKASKHLIFADEEWAKSVAASSCNSYALLASVTDGAWAVHATPISSSFIPADIAFIGWLLIGNEGALNVAEWEAKASSWMQGFFGFDLSKEGETAAASSTYRETVGHKWLGSWPQTLAEVVLDMVEDQIRTTSHWLVECKVESITSELEIEEASDIADNLDFTQDDFYEIVKDHEATTKLLKYLKSLQIWRPDEQDCETTTFLLERIEVLKKLNGKLGYFLRGMLAVV